MEVFAAGRAFLLGGGPFGDKPHLWVALTDPDPTTNKIVIAHLVTAKPHTDRTVVLNKGDHEFIDRETHVDFAGTLIVPVSRLHRAITKGRCRFHKDVTDGVLAQLRAGLLSSRRTVHAIADYCRDRFPSEK